MIVTIPCECGTETTAQLPRWVSPRTRKQVSTFGCSGCTRKHRITVSIAVRAVKIPPRQVQHDGDNQPSGCAGLLY